jgi:hypothetical protein
MILIKHDFSCGPHILAYVGYTLPTLQHETMDLVLSLLIMLHALVVTPDEHCGLQDGGRDIWIPLSGSLEHAVLMPEHSIEELAHTVDWDTLRPCHAMPLACALAAHAHNNIRASRSCPIHPERIGLCLVKPERIANNAIAAHRMWNMVSEERMKMGQWHEY